MTSSIVKNQRVIGGNLSKYQQAGCFECRGIAGKVHFRRALQLIVDAVSQLAYLDRVRHGG